MLHKKFLSLGIAFLFVILVIFSGSPAYAIDIDFGLGPSGSPTPTPPVGLSSWIKTVDGDVFAKGGISMGVLPPSGQYNTSWLGVAGGGISPLFISKKNWIISDYKSSSNSYKYKDFHAQLAGRISALPLNNINDGAYEKAGPVLTSTLPSFADKKIVLFVDGNLNVDDNYTPANASVAFIVSGDVVFSPGVSAFNGIVVVDGVLDDSVRGAAVNLPLTINGMLVSYGGYILKRFNPNDASLPGEIINYDYDLVLNLANTLGIAFFNWQEVAP